MGSVQLFIERIEKNGNCISWPRQ